MRIFSVQPDGEFREYRQTPFQVDHEERVLETWLEVNPDGIVEDGSLLIIGRQLATDLGGRIDLIGVDREGDVVVVELKRDRTPRDVVAQALEYASFAAGLDASQLEAILRLYLNDESLSLAEYHRHYYDLATDEAIAFNKDQHIVIVGQSVAPQTRQTASFLRSKGVKVTCSEFAFFQAEGGTQLLSQEIVVGQESDKPSPVSTGSLPIIGEEDFLRSVDHNGVAVFSRVLRLARDKSMPVHWGTKGFSLNADVEGNHVVVCFGYPPQSVFKQSIYTSLRGRGGMSKKTAVPESKIADLWSEAEASGLFTPAGQDLKCLIDRKMSDQELSQLIEWLESVAEVIKEYGLKE